MIIKIIHLFNAFNGMISWWFLASYKELISVKSECDSDGKTWQNQLPSPPKKIAKHMATIHPKLG